MLGRWQVLRTYEITAIPFRRKCCYKFNDASPLFAFEHFDDESLARISLR